MAYKSKVTGIAEFSTRLTEILDEYNFEIAKSAKQWAEVIANELCDNLSSSAPRLSGDYQRNWIVKKIDYSAGYFDYIVHNKKEYRLTHLLEKGHRGRSGDTVAARVHIKPLADKAKEEYYTQVRKLIENGGRK